jgi:hypothetical protein
MHALRILPAVWLSLVGASAACGALPAWLEPITWTAQPFLGVTQYQITQSLGGRQVFPRELSIQIVEIDPHSPGVTFFGSPGNGALPEEYTRQTTSSFVNSHDLAVAINADFYTTDTGAQASVNGLGMSQGAIASAAASGTVSFVLRQNNSAVVVSNGSVPTGAWNAVSGNQRLVAGGTNVTPQDGYTAALNPHSAIGVDNANGHIFLMTVDGRQTDFSEGMRTDEMADLLIAFGVDQAINLDGGGSTTLVFGDRPNGAARTVNSPSDGSASSHPGGERSVANHLGLFATPNPSYVPLPAPPRPGAPAPDRPITELTILDDFDGSEDRFASSPFGASGSTNGITAASDAVYTTAEAQAGDGSQQIVLVRDGGDSARLRHLSAGGAPQNNRVAIDGKAYAMTPQGYVGFFLKTTDADLQVGIGLDDGAVGATGLEEGLARAVIADGRWHLYEWNLADASQWSNFAGGNGAIDGPNAFLDSIFLYTGASTAGETITAFLDTVAYNPHGTLASLVRPPLGGADFKLDGQVDRRDLAIWQATYAASGADANSDGHVDGADFLAWQRQLGLGAAAAEATQAVPEFSAVLGAWAALWVAVMTGRGKQPPAND